jgi:NADH-quinone oxidoreductase subunit N
MKEIIIISVLGIVLLALDIIKLRKLSLPVAIAGLLAMITSCVLDWGNNEIPFSQYGGMLLFDNYALGFTAVLGIMGIFWMLMNSDQYPATSSRRTDMFALVIFSMCGAVVLSSFTNLVMLFLGVEILSIPVYVLAASDRKSIVSNEAGFKYFFLGALASAVLLFGIALLYGACGTFEVSEISSIIGAGNYSALMTTGVTMIIAGFAFKVSVAPFHMWAPDVYQGAPTPVTAYMATIVKGAAFAGFFRLFGQYITSLPEAFHTAMAWMIAITLILANFIAIVQSSSKRLLAYSSISHAGFLLGFVLMAQDAPAKYLLYYVLTYGIASLTAFSVLNHVASMQNGDDSLTAFKGLSKRNPVMAGAMTVSLFSMAGIPPMSGFLAKYYVISGLLSGGYVVLVVLMVVTSAIGAWYYLRLIMAMFTPIENAGRIVVGETQRLLYLLLSILIIALFFLAALVEVMGI